VTGEPDGQPQKVGVAIADLATGIYAATAILAAVHQRQTSGEGQQIDMSLMDVAASLLANQAMNYLATGTAPTKMGNAHPNLAPYAVYDCADGWIIIATGNDGQYRRLCDLLGLSALGTTPQFATNADRIANRTALTEALTRATVQRSKADLLDACEAAGVPAGPINTIDEVFADPQIVARGMRITPGGLPGIRSPMVFSGAELALDRPAPKLGEHQEEILGVLRAKP
jgi:crotonobetainyl-CoA:carnitine CoA-transferase CaiB-like acyl-CoA transferase